MSFPFFLRTYPTALAFLALAGCMNADLTWEGSESDLAFYSSVGRGLSIAGAMQVSSGSCQAYSLEAPATQAQDLSVNLFIAAGPGSFFKASDCLTPLGSVLTIAAGESTASFYYKGTGSAPLQFKAAAAGYLPAEYAPTLAIPAPGTLAVDVTTLTSITVSWVDQSTDETGFAIERSTDGVTFSPLATVAAGIITHLDSGLTTGQPYYYRVRAQNAGGASSYSAVAAATPESAPGLPTITTGSALNNLDEYVVGGACNSAATVRIFVGGVLDSTVPCTAAFYSGSVQRVADGAFAVTVRGVSTGGAASAATSSVTWTRDALAPAAPVILSPTAGTASSLTSTSVSGSCPADATNVRFHVNGSLYSTVPCTSLSFTTSFGTGSEATFAMVAYAVDLAGNQSAPSVATNWTRDATPPAVPTLGVPAADVITNANNQVVSGACAADATLVQILVNGSLDNAVACAAGAFSGSVTRATDSVYALSIRAVDAAGNLSAASSPARNWTRLTVVPAAPSGLVANSQSASSIGLAWTDNAGTESGFQIERSMDGGSSYSPLATLALNTTSYQDSGLTTGFTYFYRVRAVNVAGASTFTPAASQSPKMSVVVPIEMIDQGLSSYTTAVTFERSRTSLDMNAYDGTVTASFEIVAINSNATAKTVMLVDDGAPTTMATISVPGLTSLPTRFAASWTPQAGAHTYRIKLINTPTADQLVVYTARMLISQVGASKTMVYIPLTSGYMDTYSRFDTSSIATDTVNAITFGHGVNDVYGAWTKRAGAFTGLDATTPWTFEAVLSKSGIANAQAALYNRTTNTQIAQVMSTASVPTIATTTFLNTAANFNVGDTFEARIAGTTLGTNIYLYKAGLWAKITNLANAEVYYRVGRLNFGAAGTFGEQRTKIDLSSFSNPTAYFEALGQTLGGATTASLTTCGVNESGGGGCSVIGGSTVSIVNSNGMNVPYRSGALSLTDGDRFVTNYVGSPFSIGSATAVISVAPSP